MVIYAGYNLGYPDLENSPLVKAKKRIIDDLDRVDLALKHLKESEFLPEVQWVIVSTLFRANQGCPRLYMFFRHYTKAVRRLDRCSRKYLWSSIKYNLTDIERKMLCGEESRPEVIFGFVIAVCAVIYVAMGLCSMRNFSGGQTDYVVLAVSLTWVVLAALIYLLWKFYNGCLRRNKVTYNPWF